MAEAKAEAQESSSPRCLLLLAGGLQAACQAVSAERFCLLALASRLPTEHVSGLFNYCLPSSDTNSDPSRVTRVTVHASTELQRLEYSVIHRT